MNLQELNSDLKKLKKVLKNNNFPPKLISAIETRALRSGRRQTGHFKSNRVSRWKLINNGSYGTDPQYGTEEDCKEIFLVLLLTTLEFLNAPEITDQLIEKLFQKYLRRQINRESFKDSLLLEFLDFQQLLAEAQNPKHGHSKFHIGHLDPKLTHKHVPENIAWRTLRSNLIQGDMTLREARIYIRRLIARYFDLGEIDME